MQFSIDVDSDKNHFVANFSSSKKQLLKIAVRGSGGQTSQSKVEPTKIDTKGFLADFGTESLLQSDFGETGHFQDGVQHGCQDLAIFSYISIIQYGVLRFRAQ